MLTFAPFHPVPAQTEHPLNCCKEPVVPEPFSEVKKVGFAHEICTCLQVQLCAPGKVSKTVCKTKVATQRFCLLKDVQQNKGKRKSNNKPVS